MVNMQLFFVRLSYKSNEDNNIYWIHYKKSFTSFQNTIITVIVSTDFIHHLQMFSFPLQLTTTNMKSPYFLFFLNCTARHLILKIFCKALVQILLEVCWSTSTKSKKLMVVDLTSGGMGKVGDGEILRKLQRCTSGTAPRQAQFNSITASFHSSLGLLLTFFFKKCEKRKHGINTNLHSTTEFQSGNKSSAL